MKNIYKNFAFTLFVLMLIVSCTDNNPIMEEDETGNVQIQYNITWGSSGGSFALDSVMIHPRTEEKMEFSQFRFYVSNIKFKNTEGEWWVQPESYFIVNGSSKNLSKILIDSVPVGTYTEMEFTFGVDSLRNVSGAQTGALAITNDLFWSWSTGYIMMKAEGTANDSMDFSYHLGGFYGVNNIVKSKQIIFTDALEVSEFSVPTLNLNANAARLWHTINGITERKNIHMPGSFAVTAATDFVNGITFKNIE